MQTRAGPLYVAEEQLQHPKIALVDGVAGLELGRELQPGKGLHPFLIAAQQGAQQVDRLGVVKV